MGTPSLKPGIDESALAALWLVSFRLGSCGDYGRPWFMRVSLLLLRLLLVATLSAKAMIGPTQNWWCKRTSAQMPLGEPANNAHSLPNCQGASWRADFESFAQPRRSDSAAASLRRRPHRRPPASLVQPEIYAVDGGAVTTIDVLFAHRLSP